MQINAKVRKAVIPAAGLGTRMLPIARTVPKEVLPIVDRPAISYLVEEAARSGITDVLIITGRNKGAIEDYFDYSPEYEANFVAKGRNAEIDAIRASAEPLGVRVYFLRQKVTKGLGHAIGCARNFVGDEPFAILYGDDIIFSEKPVVAQMIETYGKYGRAVCGVKEVPTELVRKYCSLKTHPIEGSSNEFFVDDMIEKPKTDAEIFSNYSILGRVLVTPDIFDIIDNTPPGAGGEIQLTDAIAALARREGVTALDFEGKRFDLGSKLGFLEANVTLAMSHPEVAADFKEFLIDFVKNM
ncbi:MAG: UTP--glucose-1-phosphate uridylyltransferase [Eubacteriales bacterium]